MGLGPALRRCYPHRCVLSLITDYSLNVILLSCSGVRLGISEHMDDNRMAFGFSLTKQDHAAIEEVLNRSQGSNMIDTIGDCGAEYRS